VQQGDMLLDRLVRGGKVAAMNLARSAGGPFGVGNAATDQEAIAALEKEKAGLNALSKQYAYPTLVDAPDSQRFSRELVTGHEPFSAAAEAIRSIRSAISANALARGTRSIAVVGPHQGAGATYLIGNLAVGFAQMGISTLLVDANLRAPRAAELFGFSPAAEGLSELLLNKGRVLTAVRSNVISNLSVLPAGSKPPNPQELLSSPEFLALTDAFHERFGVVLYDTAHTDDCSDAFVVASRINSAIVVTRRHKTSYQQVSTLTKKLESLGCSLVGTVLNDF
jgi:capsular exopolysaccharide synthesis family protein